MANETEIRSKGFILYEEDEDLFDELDGEETKALIKACFAYHNRGEDLTGTMNGFARRAFKLIKRNMIRDAEKYIETVTRNRENGRKGGRPKNPVVSPENPKNPLGFSENPKNPLGFSENPKNPTKTKTKAKAEAQTEALAETKNKKPGIELSPPGDRLSSKPSDKPSEEELAAMFGNFMNRQRNRMSSQDREAHLQSVGFYDMTADEKIAYLEEERRRKRANS